MVTPEEQALIADRMAEAGISNMGAYMRKMALNGYVLHVDLSDIRELVALQRRCANNHLRHLSLGDRGAPKGLCRPLGAAVRAAEKAVGCGEPMTCRGAALRRSPAFTTSGHFVPRYKN